MSYWIALLTDDELNEASVEAEMFYGGSDKWYEDLSAKGLAVETFDFGDIPEYSFFGHMLSEINELKSKVDDLVALLEFLFLQGSESQQVDMFLRFLAANLTKNKIVHFYKDDRFEGC